eukprot:scaffold1001_cov169-Amphora_coffeaeformis.AAC.19
MGNAPSTEGETRDDGTKTVTFSASPPGVAVNNEENDSQRRSSSSSSSSSNDDDDSDDEQEEPTNSSPAPPRRGLPDDMRRSSYFDLVTGTRITALGTGFQADIAWRNSNKSIRMISGGEIEAPAPQWRRTLRKLGMIKESSKARVDNIQTNMAASSLPSDAPSDKAPQKQQENKPDPSVRHFRIESKAFRNDRSSLLLDSTKTASFVSEYLRWTFTKSFAHVMLATFLQFLFLCTLFAVFIYVVDLEQPQCITGATRSSKNHIVFGDAYQLSWTTLSTVGYGVIFPSLAEVDEADTRCLGLNILMAIEAFIGVLFGGVTGGRLAMSTKTKRLFGRRHKLETHDYISLYPLPVDAAIIFGKIARIQSIASVRFSHPVVIRFGLGVVGTGDNDAEPDEDDDDENNMSKEKKEETGNVNVEVEWPCPVLEFRILNELSERIGGEIMNATINVAACLLERMTISEEYASPQGAILAKKKKKPNGSILKEKARAVGAHASGVVHHAGKAVLGGSREAAHLTGNLIQKLHHGLSKPLHHHQRHHHNHSTHDTETDPQGDESKPFNAAEAERRFKEQIARELESATQQQLAVTVDEGNAKLVPRRTYFKLEIETDSHPFFKRVWNIRHVLNERSPLLSMVARRMIVNNGGSWPVELNNHQALRKHVHFEELVVSMAGTSNVSGCSVYAQKIYDYEHLNVGYSFAPILALDDSGLLVVDHRLLNDVREQHGGGGEPIQKINQTAAESAQAMERIEQLDELSVHLG